MSDEKKAEAAARADDFHRLAMMLDAQASTVAPVVVVATEMKKEKP